MEANQKRKGYTLEEMDRKVKEYIHGSAERLKKELRKTWKNNIPKNFKLRKIQ